MMRESGMTARGPKNPGAPSNAFLIEGAGNRFILLDGLVGDGPWPAAELEQDWIRETCSRRWGAQQLSIDGILCLSRDCDSGSLRMIVHNRDGSRPEACGNGLRCVAQHAQMAGYFDQAPAKINTDAGPRAVRLHSASPGTGATPIVDGPAVQLGRARITGRDQQLVTAEGTLRVTLVDMGNPHCVLWVEDPQRASVAALGALIEGHERFPQGTNVEFAAQLEDRSLSMRVWERGVGETQACGTGACAVAVARRGVAPWPVKVTCPGGELLVDRDGQGELWLAGPILQHGALELA